MRCGPASCASVLLSEGWQSDPWALTLQLDAQVDPDKNGTTSQQLLALMSLYGFSGGLWDTWDDLYPHWEHGHAVLLLNQNWLLSPRPYPASTSFNATHWIRLLVEAGPDQMIYVYDPLTYLYQPDGKVFQGPTVATSSSCKAAGDATGYPEYGIYLISPSGKNLNVGH